MISRNMGILISGNGSTMQTILDISEVHVRVVIADNPLAYGILRARRSGIPVEVLPKELRGKVNRPSAEKWLLEKLKIYRVKNLFLAGFMKILSPDFIFNFKNVSGGEVVNIHPSLLPAHKGLNAYELAMESGDQYLGVTVHHVVPEVDSGQFLGQRKFEKSPKLFMHIQEQELLKSVLRKDLR